MNLLVDTKEASEILGVSPSTLKKYRTTGDGPAFYKFGRSVRYDPEEIDRYLTARKFSNTSQYFREDENN